MNEPLTMSRPGIAFSGKTHNQHPQWYNQPIRLREERLNNPLDVLEEFFQAYHLHDTREILWQWLTAVITSPGSTSNEPLERSNHIYFYEKLEEVIEAAFVMKTNHSAVKPDTTSNGNLNLSRSTRQEETADAEEAAFKTKRLIEYANDDPLFVIQEVFNPASWSFNYLKVLVEIALVSEDDAYSEPDDRQNLVIFRDHLHILLESLYIIYLQKIPDSAKKEWSQKVYSPHLLSKEQVGNPRQIMVEFFEKYPMSYTLRELEDLLEAGITHTGPWPDEITSPWLVFHTYRNILCLVKAAEQLLTPHFSTIIK